MSKDLRRISVNTSLKNARIFDEDYWDSEIVKTEIKTEPVDDDTWDSQDFDGSLKHECETPVKQEIEVHSICEDTLSSPIKQERLDFENKLSFKDEDDEDSRPDPWEPATVPKNERLTLKPHRRTDTSQKNLTQKRNLSSVFSLDIKRPKIDSKKRTISTRSSESETNSDMSGKNHAAKKKPNNKRYETESDPEVLRRRQKQIDFGKNTVGYSNYLIQVPRYERSFEDPQTPNKYRKYSRRGWDGLIKQWRLKLHNYDPVEINNDLEKDI